MSWSLDWNNGLLGELFKIYHKVFIEINGINEVHINSSNSFGSVSSLGKTQSGNNLDIMIIYKKMFLSQL